MVAFRGIRIVMRPSLISIKLALRFHVTHDGVAPRLFHSILTLYQMVEGAGFEPAKLSRQIYSLIPLTAREPLRKFAPSYPDTC